MPGQYLKLMKGGLVAIASLATAACFEFGSSSDDSSGGADAGAGATPPPPPPAGGGQAVGDAVSAEDASRFLTQATFGPTQADIDSLVSSGLSAWMQNEFAKPQESILQGVLVEEAAGADIGDDELSEAFWTRAILSDDQLRQRVGYALSQIFVASYSDPGLEDRPFAMANYMDIMSAGAFGNLRQTLENVTYSPAMSIYLTYLQNQKADAEREVVPDENYAREVMQLFTIGLVELQPNGEPVLDANGSEIETYDNLDVTELAKVFTGLSWGARDRFFGRPENTESEFSPLEMYDEEHSPEEKNFLGVSIPANTGGNESIAIALDTLFNHQNTPPFLSKQLIQRLVTSNPTPAYVGRVADAFRSGTYMLPNGESVGDGVRGDMRAVIAAILLDPEARDPAMSADTAFGKIREPVLRFTHWARAFRVRETGLEDVGRARDTTAPNRLNQQAYRSPSVFNFYRPGFVAPGSESAAAGLVAPELQITTASSVVGYANFIEDFIFEDVSDVSFQPNYAPELALVNNAPALIDHLDLLLTYGTLSPETRARAIAAVESVEGNNRFPRDETRIHTAILFIMTSPDYLVQR